MSTSNFQWRHDGLKNMIKHEEEGFIYQTDAPYMIAYYVDKIFSMKADATLIGAKAREHALQTHDPIINGRIKQKYKP